MKLIYVSSVEIAKEQIVRRGSSTRLCIDFFICSAVDITIFANTFIICKHWKKLIWVILSFYVKTFNLEEKMF